MDDNKNYNTFEILLIGDNFIGKRSLMIRLDKDTFTDVVNRCDIIIKYSKIDNQLIRVVISDIRNAHRYNFRPKEFSGIVMCYDISNRNSFNFDGYLKIIKNFNKVILEKCVFVLVGLKSDLDNKREVSFEEGLNFANKLNIFFIECSSKSGENVHDILTYIIKELNDMKDLLINNRKNSIVLPNEGQESYCYFF